MPDSRKEHRVFVVHDEFVIASSLAALLRHQGFDARSFTDPLKALSAAGSEAPEMLISDSAMPLISGAELAIQVRQHNPHCEVLLFSRRAATGLRLEPERSNPRDPHTTSTSVQSPERFRAISAECKFASCEP